MNVQKRSIRRVVRQAVLVVTVAILAAASAPVHAQEDENVQVTDYGTVTLTVKDTDLAQVLEMLAIQSKKNIITSKAVSATISANLYDVTFYEALDAILRVNGYGYLEEGNFIYVYTGAEMSEIEERLRQTESRVYELEYLAAADAYEFILPLLSDQGQASYRGEVEPGFKPEIGNGGADSYALAPALVVNDYKRNLDEIGKLLSELDIAPEQVLVEATILQTTLDESNAFGVDFSIIGSLNFTDLTRPLAAVTNIQNGNDSAEGFQPDDNKAITTTSTVGGTAGTAGLRIGVLTDDIAIFLRLLDEVTDSTVLARPKIMCLNRQRAEVLVGARIGYLSTTATETTTTQTVEFLDTGIQLVFRPFVSPGGMVRLELAPSVSEASLRTVTDSNGLIVTIPDELTNELTTNVRVRDGSTLVLGGLFRESTRVTRRQVPVLGDVPLLGAAFRGQEDIVDRDEIIFLITPSVVDDEEIDGVGRDALAYAESSRVGTREHLLPFSQTRMADKHNRDAVAAYQAGDLETALFHVNNSLRLRQTQPDMVRFRAQLTGAAYGAHEISLLERVLRRELGLTNQPRLESNSFGPMPPAHYTGLPPVILTPAKPVDQPLSDVLEVDPSMIPTNEPDSVAASIEVPAEPVEVQVPEIPEDELNDSLFRSFFESLETPRSTPGGASVSATPMSAMPEPISGADTEAVASQDIDSQNTESADSEFEDMVQMVEVPSSDTGEEN